MISNIIENRISALKSFLPSNKAAILLSNEVNIGYFCGFFHSEGYLLITDSKTVLFVDFRYFEAAQKFAVNCEVVCFNKFYQALSEQLKKYEIKSVFIETKHLTLNSFFKLKDKLNEISVDCISDDKLDIKVSDIRCIKDETEIEKIQTAQNITESAYLEVLNYLKPGVTERQIAIELEYMIKLKGGSDISFDLITITGKKTSLPHGVPSNDVVCNGDFFTFDIGAVYDGYHSDTTRTVAIGYADDEMRKIYDIVLEAQLAVLEKIKPGLKCSEADKTAREIITNAGYGKYFGHSTGHGVGLDIHEAPGVSYNNDTVLKEGMVITDEPGIYLPNKFGVRIEDMICVTKDGYKNFVSLPKELIIV